MAKALDNVSDLDASDEEDTHSGDTLFNRATEHVKILVSKLDTKNLLELYSHYKQATEGPCSIARPSWYELQAKQKWEAWNSLGNLSCVAAKEKYVEIVQDLDPNWLSDSNKKKGKNESWVSVSTMYNSDDILDDDKKTVFDFCQEGNVMPMKNLLKDNSQLLRALDEEGLGLIHWAADRGHLDVLKALIESKCDINLVDSTGQTALHYAVSCEHFECVKYLLDCSASRDIRDEDNVTPLDVCTNETIRKLFL